MNREELIKVTEEFVRRKVSCFDSSQDWWHIVRVKNMASIINNREALADSFILEIAALLHDTADSKFTVTSFEQEYSAIGNFMDEAGMIEIKERVIKVIRNVSFTNRNPAFSLQDPVLQILQDADRLDAIGAIGIARVFSYGGFRNNPIYFPGNGEPMKNSSSIAHFYDKLLKLKDLMNTSTGRIIAEERHRFLEDYLEQFYKEWEFAT
jgi:uncharacterized protein